MQTIGRWLHLAFRGHEPEWFVIAYDRGHAIWKCHICDLGRPTQMGVPIG